MKKSVSQTYVVGKRRSMLMVFSDNCRYSYLILFQNPANGSLLKICCNEESKTLTMNFSYFIALKSIDRSTATRPHTSPFPCSPRPVWKDQHWGDPALASGLPRLGLDPGVHSGIWPYGKAGISFRAASPSRPGVACPRAPSRRTGSGAQMQGRGHPQDHPAGRPLCIFLALFWL